MNPRDFRPSPHAGTGNHAGEGAALRPRRPDRCIALIDPRFLEWLCGQDTDAGDAPAPHRDRLPDLLLDSLADAGCRADLLRIYWYASQRDAEVVDGQVLRAVQPDAADAGASLVQAMARDLMQLAEHRACDVVLLATDDDRLLTAVDAAQLRGLRVHLLADESAHDLAALGRSDPAWAALLRQADRRVVVTSATLEQVLWGEGLPADRYRHPLAAALPRGLPRRRHGGESDEGHDAGPAREVIDALVQGWWQALGETDQRGLQDQLPAQRGLPQEADRQLLLQLSQRLGRPLSVPEKKLMREQARALAMGPTGEGMQGAQEGPASAGASQAEAPAPAPGLSA